MKKNGIIFLFAAMGLLAGCLKEQPAAEINQGSTLEVSIAPETPAAPEVKTHLGAAENNKRKVYWSDGDAIRVNGVASNALAEQGETASSAVFQFASPLGAAPYNILYPAGIYTDATHVTLPASQTYKSGGFADGMFPMAGYSADGTNISVNHLCAILKLNILRDSGAGADEHDLVSASFRGLQGEQVSGTFAIDYQNATLTGSSAAAADQVVKVTKVFTTSTATPVSYYIVVPARTYAGGIAVDIQDKGGHMMTLSKTSSFTLQAGKLYDLSALPFVPTGDAPADITITSAEELIAFAQAYNAGTISGDDLLVSLGNDITFDATTSAAFNAEGGIGRDKTFNGTFNGANHSINGLQATVALFGNVGKNGTVRNLIMGSTSSLTYTADIAGNLNIAAIAGYCKGNITDCENYAPVTCSSTTRTAGVIKLGGIVGRQNSTGTISGCVNHAAITCTAPGTPDIYMGGIVGAVERPNAGETALIENCTNEGMVKNGKDSGEPAQSCILHMGGIVGWIYTSANSPTMVISGLVNTGSVIKTNTASKVNTYAEILGGIVGGVHGTAIANPSGTVVFKNSTVSNCSIINGAYDNGTGYGTAPHTGGFIGVARGGSISFNSSCEVNNVTVGTRRGYGGGFAAWARGATFDGCKVLNSSVRASGAWLRYGGGLVGHMRSSNAINCTVTLNNNSTNSLFGKADGENDVFIGGIAGSAQETCIVSGCKAFVKLFFLGACANTSAYGWILGKDNDNSVTIQDCGLGGTYGNGTPSLTLDDSNFSNYIYGAGTPVVQGTNYYWDGNTGGGVDPGPFPKRLAIIGDSISTFEGIIPASHRPYYTNPPAAGCDVTDWTQTYWGRLISDYWHSTLDVNTSWSGSSVASGKAGAERTPFVDDSRLGLLTNPDCVILFGGTNDAIAENEIGLGEFCYDTALADINHYKRFRDAYIYVIKYIQNKFPSAKIICIIGTDVSGDYGNSVEAIAQHYSLPYVDFRGEKKVAGKVTIFSGSHPDAAGHAYKAQKIYNETLHLFQ